MGKAVLIIGTSGSGKGQPKTDIIPTPNGDVVFGDLQVGDKVFGSTGQPTTVTAIHDRGFIPTYEVLFSDGSKKIVDGDHVWTLERNRDGKIQYRDVTTKDLEGKRLARYFIPMTAVEYTEKELPIDPYLLGLWLADGSMYRNNVKITKHDAHVVEYLKTKASSYKEYDGVYQFSFTSENPYLNRELLNQCGFDDLTRSRQKAIPTDYLLSSIKQRKELLRGLLDGDGSVRHPDRDTAQSKLYSTTSITLAKTVHRLVTSLGIVARDIHIVDKREGKTDYYQVSFNDESKYNKRSIKAVVRIEDKDIQCIEVDDSRHLYVCDTYNHLLTHNSTSARNFKKDELALVNVMGKDLPFPTKFDSTIKSTDYETIMRAMLSTEKKSIMIDDAGYLITSYFMKNHVSAADKFAIYNEMADRHWGLIRFITEKLPEDTIVYLVQHEDVDELGRVKPKTIGKLLDDKVCLEGLFSIVLRSEVKDGKYQFLTHGEGTKGAKTPIGMFEEDYIDNDLKMVDERIREYYDNNNNEGE